MRIADQDTTAVSAEVDWAPTSIACDAPPWQEKVRSHRRSPGLRMAFLSIGTAGDGEPHDHYGQLARGADLSALLPASLASRA